MYLLINKRTNKAFKVNTRADLAKRVEALVNVAIFQKNRVNSKSKVQLVLLSTYKDLEIISQTINELKVLDLTDIEEEKQIRELKNLEQFIEPTEVWQIGSKIGFKEKTK